MARPLRTGSVETLRDVEAALAHLRRARDLLVGADAPQTLARVRAAIASGDGARRHAHRRASEFDRARLYPGTVVGTHEEQP